MKKFIGGLLFAVIATCSVMVYSVSNSDIEDLILCASPNKSHYIPQSLCKTYLYQYRGTAKDIQYLESRSGISFIFGLDDNKDKERLFEFLLSKNIDVNKISPVDGFTPLHAAVLENNLSLVDKLLKNSADKTIISPATNGTPLELAQQLQAKGQQDYSAIIKLLKP